MTLRYFRNHATGERGGEGEVAARPYGLVPAAGNGSKMNYSNEKLFFCSEQYLNYWGQRSRNSESNLFFFNSQFLLRAANEFTRPGVKKKNSYATAIKSRVSLFL